MSTETSDLFLLGLTILLQQQWLNWIVSRFVDVKLLICLPMPLVQQQQWQIFAKYETKQRASPQMN